MIQFTKNPTTRPITDTILKGRCLGTESERAADDVVEEQVEGASGELELDTLELGEDSFDAAEECPLDAEYCNEEPGEADYASDLQDASERDAELEGEGLEELDVSSPATSCEAVSDPLGLYLTEIGRYPLLSREEERQTAADIRSWRHQLADTLFKSDFVARKAVLLIRSLLESKAQPDASPDDDTERIDSLFIFKRDGSDGKGGTKGTKERLTANIATIERLLGRIKDAVPLMYGTSLSSEVRFEQAQFVFRARSKIATLLHETGMRRSLLKSLEREFLTAEKDLSSSPSGNLSLELFGESASRLARRVFRVKVCDERYEGARQKLYQHNLRLVVSNAKNWASNTEELLERIQAGNEGLGIAVDAFDDERGFKFSTYATPWIKQRQRRDQFESGQSIQRKVSSTTLVNKVRRAQAEFSQRYDRRGDEYELAEFTGMSLENVRRGLMLMRPSVSLDVEIGARGKENRMTLGETLPAREEEDYGSRMDREWLRRLTHPDSKILNRRESLVVRLRFGVFSDQEHISLGQEHGVDTREGLTLQQVGKILRVTRERVRQIEGKALQKLQNVLKRRGDLSES